MSQDKRETEEMAKIQVSDEHPADDVDKVNADYPAIEIELGDIGREIIEGMSDSNPLTLGKILRLVEDALDTDKGDIQDSLRASIQSNGVQALISKDQLLYWLFGEDNFKDRVGDNNEITLDTLAKLVDGMPQKGVSLSERVDLLINERGANTVIKNDRLMMALMMIAQEQALKQNNE